MTLQEALALYLRYLEFRRGATPSTLITYRSVLGQFCLSLGDIGVEALTLVEIDAYAEHLSLKNFKPKTYRNKLCIIRSFVRFLYAKELTLIRPESVDVPPERPAEDTTHLFPDEKARILAAASTISRDHAMLHVLLASGLRVSELTNLKTTDIFRRTVSVKHGKGMKNRVTFINGPAEAAVEAYKREQRGYADGYLFPNPHGDRLSRVIVARKVRLYAVKAEIKRHITVHTLRHTFATQYLDDGGRIEDLQQLLGHADLKTTMLYLHFTNERLHSSYDKVM